jgi:hypothetical protein
MLHAIVEGEPGIFPDPIARIMRGIGGLFRKREEEQAPAPPPPGPGEADDPADRDERGETGR